MLRAATDEGRDLSEMRGDETARGGTKLLVRRQVARQNGGSASAQAPVRCNPGLEENELWNPTHEPYLRDSFGIEPTRQHLADDAPSRITSRPLSKNDNLDRVAFYTRKRHDARRESGITSDRIVAQIGSIDLSERNGGAERGRAAR
jgi:hypothetical protein